MDAPKYDRIVLGRNNLVKGWGLLALSLFYIPESFLAAVGGPLKLILRGLLQLASSLAGWMLARIMLTAGGLAGFLKVNSEYPKGK